MLRVKPTSFAFRLTFRISIQKVSQTFIKANLRPNRTKEKFLGLKLAFLNVWDIV